MDRRRFLHRTTLGSAAAGLAWNGASWAAGSAPSRRVTIGVMGLSRGRALAVGFAGLPGVEIKYVCDADTKRWGDCAKSIEVAGGGTPQAVQDFRRILDDPAIDALICAAPNHWHAPATILACAANKHVYVEKPCSHNPQEGQWMVQVARAHGRAVQVGTQRRSGPAAQEAIAQLRDGAIGRVHLARSWYSSARGPIGKGQPAPVPANLDYDLWQGPALRRPYLSNRVHYNWHWFWHWGNGELGNNGVHTLDLCRWGVQVDYPVRVTSSGGRYWYDDDQETPDTHTVSFEFEGDRAITWHCLSCNRHPVGFVTFYGADGALELNSDGSYRIYDAGDRLIKQQSSPSTGDREHLVNFVEAIRESRTDHLNAEIEDGHKSALLCHLGNIAHRTGRTLDCDPSNGHILKDEQAMKYWAREYESGWEPNV